MEPRFNEEEGARILARAVELQHQSVQAATISLADLERVAAEAGVGPRFVHQAALEATQPEAAPKERVVFSLQEDYWKVAFAAALLQVIGVVSLAQANPGLGNGLILLTAPVLLGVATARRSAYRSVSFAVWVGSTLFGNLLLWIAGALSLHQHSLGGNDIGILELQTTILLAAWLIGSLAHGVLRQKEAIKRPSQI